MTLTLRKSTLCSLYILSLLTTEFWHIDFFGGTLRIYDFATPLVIIVLYRYFSRLMRSAVIWAIFAFLLANLLSALLAASPAAALFSLGLLCTNAAIAVAVGLIVASGLLSHETVIRLALAAAVASVVFGIAQIAGLHLGNVALALSDDQRAQLMAGFAPGFKTEANTQAKFLNVVFLMVLPFLLRRHGYRHRALLFTILVTGMLVALTRSAIYGLAISLALIYLVHVFAARSRILAGQAVVWGLIGVAVVAFFATIAGDFSAYAAEKLRIFFNLQASLQGGSAVTRLMSQDAVWNAFLHSEKSILLGNGWGQIYVQVGGSTVHAGGGELVTALGFGGVLGGVLYLMYQFAAIAVARRAVLSQPDTGLRLAAQGILYATLGLLVTGQLNGSMIAPEYWMVFGLAAGLRAVVQCKAVAARPAVGVLA